MNEKVKIRGKNPPTKKPFFRRTGPGPQQWVLMGLFNDFDGAKKYYRAVRL